MSGIRVLYFAWLRERVGRGEEDMVLPESIRSVADLVSHLQTRDAKYAAAFANPRVVRAAVNQVFARLETALADGDEVAFFPPVTGG
jgi:molybdopterin synthase sulfur carrier subunit